LRCRAGTSSLVIVDILHFENSRSVEVPCPYLTTTVHSPARLSVSAAFPLFQFRLYPRPEFGVPLLERFRTDKVILDSSFISINGA
jgi:hypothetical protein